MTRPAAGRRFLLVLLVVATILLAMVIAPFAGGLFAAAVFAVVLRPAHLWLAAAFGKRPRLSAGVITLGLLLVVLVPLTWLGIVVVQQTAAGIDRVKTVVEQKGTDGLIEELPASVRPMARSLRSLLPEGWLPEEPKTVEQPPAQATKPANADPLIGGVKVAGSVVMGIIGMAIETGVMLVALFFLLVQGPQLVHWIVATAPLPDRQMEQFVAEFHDVTLAVFVSTVVTAALQAGVAAIGYLIAGIPLFAMALMLTFVAAFIPAIGGATVAVSIGVLVLVTDSTGWGIFLIAWGLVVVALIDNVANPLLAQRKLRLPGAVLFFAMLGGIAVFGPMGVVAGPLIVSFFLVVVRALGAGRSRAATAGT